MTILSLESVSKQYGENPLFTDVTFGIERGEHVGVIGVNGSGKTTLLRIAAGVEDPDSGRVTRMSGIRVAYLPQNPNLDPDMSVFDAVFAGESPMTQLLREYEQISAALARTPNDSALLDRLNELAPHMDARNAWEAETAARTILSQLGLANDIDKRLGALSGGQRRRAAMAQALIEQPDVIVLDEPTNHIDTDTIAWLEGYLARMNSALFLVTHDRYFLDRVVSRMIELDRGRVFTYAGNYAGFLEQKAAREERAVAAEEARQNLLRKELAWLRRGARARTTKQKAHVQRVHDLMEQRSDASQGTVDIDVAGARRIGKRVIELRHVSKRYADRTLIDDFSLEVSAADRIGIIGPNSSGKSTLLNIIAGSVATDSGAAVRGETVHLAYYDQESAALDESQRVIDYIRDAAEQVRGADGALASAAQMLERFLFPSKAQWMPIAKLSGGERRRLYLLRKLMFAPNLLLLDEPTNDLDIQTLTVLEDYIDSFKGAVIAVSHDRYFLDRVAQRLLAFTGDGQIREYPGGYSLYEEFRAREAAAATSEPPRRARTEAPARPRREGPRRLSANERRELKTLEARIPELEARQAALSEQLNGVDDDYQAYQRLADDIAQVAADLEAAMERWVELAELAEQSG